MQIKNNKEGKQDENISTCSGCSIKTDVCGVTWIHILHPNRPMKAKITKTQTHKIAAFAHMKHAVQKLKNPFYGSNARKRKNRKFRLYAPEKANRSETLCLHSFLPHIKVQA